MTARFQCRLGLHDWKFDTQTKKVMVRYDSPFPNSVYPHDVEYLIKKYHCFYCLKTKEKWGAIRNE